MTRIGLKENLFCKS